MALTSALTLVAALPLVIAQATSNETVLGVYIFHRHGDRTPKILPSAKLTDLGYQEVYTSGQWFRERYIASNAPYQINGISPAVVNLAQISVSAPQDNVLQSSAIGFLQGLYPPVGQGLDQETLRNGTVVTAPMQGYQLIPVQLVSSGSGSEDNTWLQSASGCAAATISSNNFFNSQDYLQLQNSTMSFYQDLLPVTNGTFNSSTMSFKNAYTIFDLINVAEIHNATINSSDLLTNETLFQLRTLADNHEWGLAYNASDNMRAVAGMTLAAQILQFLNGTITGKGAQKIGIQFGAYASFMSFFGLAIPDIATSAPDLMGVADYASAMTIEMFTNTSTTVSVNSYPSVDDIYVRMLFHNGTTSNISEPIVHPLFGSGQPALKFNDFANGMNKFALGTTQQWCIACGNFTGTCAAYGNSSSSGNSSSPGGSSSGSRTTGEESSHRGNGLTPVVNGVIGAMVTLAVILGLEALILFVGGLRVVSKRRLASAAGIEATSIAGNGPLKA